VSEIVVRGAPAPDVVVSWVMTLCLVVRGEGVVTVEGRAEREREVGWPGNVSRGTVSPRAVHEL